MESDLDVVAERCLTLSKDGEARQIRIALGRPYQEPDEAYFCPYRITGIGVGSTKRAGGVDSIQAVQLAFVLIGGELSPYAESLKWNGEPFTGFPVSIHDTALGAG
jgi:hypothetical protein